jgi:hypothetical protein
MIGGVRQSPGEDHPPVTKASIAVERAIVVASQAYRVGMP